MLSFPSLSLKGRGKRSLQHDLAYIFPFARTSAIAARAS